MKSASELEAARKALAAKRAAALDAYAHAQPSFTVARIAANMAGLGAFQYQQQDPRHIAAAWVEFRRFNVAPDEGMLKWIDRLAADVLDPTPAKVRPKENAVRDLEIYRLVHVHLEKGVAPADAYADAAAQFGLTPKNIGVIVGRVERSLADPYDGPRAFRDERQQKIV